MERSLLELTRAIYKGDKLSSTAYIGVACIFGVIAVLLYLFTHKAGLYYLSIGLGFFSLYAGGKGIFVRNVASARLNYYLRKSELQDSDLNEELKYAKYRIAKKQTNRSGYAWTFSLAMIAAFIGSFSGEKGLLIGTAIPVVLLASLEFVVSLFTEFRLWEYLRQLEKPRDQ